MKFNHLLDQLDIGKSQSEQAHVRLQNAMNQNIAFEKEISAKIREIYELPGSKNRKRREKLALAEGLRQAGRMSDLLEDVEAKLAEREATLTQLKVTLILFCRI